MRATLKIIIFILSLVAFATSSMAQGFGSIDSESTFKNENREDLWIAFDYQDAKYVLSYADIPKQEYTLEYNSATNVKNQVLTRPMYVYKKTSNGWKVESGEVFTGLSTSSIELDFKSYPIKSGGAALVTDLENGYILITQTFKRKIYGKPAIFEPIFVLLKFNSDSDSFDWIINRFMPNEGSPDGFNIWAKQVKKISDDHYSIVMSNDRIVNLYFNHKPFESSSNYEVWWKSEYNWKGSN